MSGFTIPRDLYYGDNAMEELKNLQGHKKAIIVKGGSSMKRVGFLDKCEKILKEAGLEVDIFEKSYICSIRSRLLWKRC